MAIALDACRRESGWRGPSPRSAHAGSWARRSETRRQQAAARSDSRRSRPRTSGLMRLTSCAPATCRARACRTAIAFEMMRAAGAAWRTRRNGWRAPEMRAVFQRALVGDEFDRTPRRASSLASASAGNRWPPVPPAARRTQRSVARHFTRSMIAERGRRRVTAMRKPMPMRKRQQRRAAIGDERQRHALGRHQMQVDAHVDGALQAEQHDEARRREAAERILVARSPA